MKKQMMMIGLALLAGMAQATVLTFDTGGGMPQAYGDFVTNTNMGAYSYGEAGEGFTPNVAVEYIGDGGDGLDFWATGYGDLVNVVENEDDGERWTIIRFEADPGCETVLHSMDLGNYNSGSLLIDRISITNESGTVLLQQDNVTLAGSGSGHTNINFGSVTGQVLTLVLDLQTAAATSDNDSVGLDNITFSQDGVATIVPPPEVEAGSFLIDFEEYSAGVAPPAPWTSDPGASVSSAIKYTGTNSLRIDYTLYDKAHYPFTVLPEETASFSVWVRPGLYKEVNAQFAAVGIEPSNTARPRTLQFNRDWHTSSGSTPLSLQWDEMGATVASDGDFTAGSWYLVTCDISLDSITFSITTESGPLSYSFDRYGEEINNITLGYSNTDAPAYYDDLIITPPASPPTNVTLNVYSAHGSPIPGTGSNSYVSGSTVTCSVVDVTSGTTQYECSGWTGTGSVPASGTSNAVEVTLTEDSSITWNWQTNYWLDVNVTGNGSVNVPDGFYAKGSEQILTATPDAGWLFMGWSGDASGTNEAFVMMTEPQTVMATFSDDADGDGLLNSNETVYGSNPWNSDTDGDGFGDKLEMDNGGSPTVSDQWRVDYINANGSDFNLYASNVVLDVALGEILMDVIGTEATLSLQLETSEDLQSWTDAGETNVWSWTVGEEKKFFRVRSGK